jgi:hypothetical protein
MDALRPIGGIWVSPEPIPDNDPVPDTPLIVSAFHAVYVTARYLQIVSTTIRVMHPVIRTNIRFGVCNIPLDGD